MLMSSHVVVNLALGIAALVLLLPLGAAKGRTRQMMFGLALGLGAAILAINGLTSALHMSRESEMRSMVKYALQNADGAKAHVVLIGSSLTALGVDNALVTRELQAKGYSIQVVNLARLGSDMISEEYVLDYYLAHVKKVPEYVFIEIGPESFADPGAMGGDRLDGESIADHGVDRAWSRARSIYAYPGPPSQKFDDYWKLATHALFNAFDFGLSGQLVADAEVQARPGFLVRHTRRHHMRAIKSDIDEVITPAHLLSQDGALPTSLRFVLAFRRMQIHKLRALGVKVVGFYEPEVPSAQTRDYGMQECHELRGVPCILAGDPALQRKLDDTSMWYDDLHLLYPGAEVYSTWLANRLTTALAPGKIGMK